MLTFHTARRALSLIVLLALLLLPGLLAQGCVTVAPYQREALTHPGMSSEGEEREESFRAHSYDAREGAAGGHGGTGGGCGCN